MRCVVTYANSDIAIIIEPPAGSVHQPGRMPGRFHFGEAMYLCGAVVYQPMRVVLYERAKEIWRVE